ncbi:MAG: cytochrome c [Halarcobacter sp.]
MKIFNKIIICIFFIFSLSINLDAKKIRGEYATKNFLGQEYYLKNCSSCHGDGNRGGNMSSIREWKMMFDNNAEELIYLHEEDENNIALIKYLKGESFNKQSKIMLEFLQEFAYDSEHIPTCN